MGSAATVPPLVFLSLKEKVMAKKSAQGKNEDTNSRVRKLGDDVVTPAQYDGTRVGNGKYISGMVNGKLITDGSTTDTPLHWKEIGQLV